MGAACSFRLHKYLTDFVISSFYVCRTQLVTGRLRGRTIQLCFPRIQERIAANCVKNTKDTNDISYICLVFHWVKRVTIVNSRENANTPMI